MNNTDTIYVCGMLAKRKARIIINFPHPGDKEYAEDIFKKWDTHTAFLLKGNMEIELLDDEVEKVIVEYNKIFIKITDPSPKDIKYISMLIQNWKNYYKPENYLLPNTEIIQLGDHLISSTQAAPNHRESQD